MKAGDTQSSVKPVTVRFPPLLLKRLMAAAKVNGRSRNSEIVLRLTNSLERDRRRK